MGDQTTLPPIRDSQVHRYLEPWLSVHYGQSAAQTRIDLNCAADAIAKPNPSRDESLTAFCQLAALRLNCRRALVSLIDSQAQYVLAEATKSVSLDGKEFVDADDELLIGRVNIVRKSGVCGGAINSMLSENVRLPSVVVPDLIEDDRFNGYAWINEDSPYRFYAGVPIFSPENHIIGVYCVFDNNPRAKLASYELKFLHATARSIYRHLEGVRMRLLQTRGERMIKSLDLFMGGQASVRQWWLTDQHRCRSNGDSIYDSDTELLEAADELFGPEHEPGCLPPPPVGLRHSLKPPITPKTSSDDKDDPNIIGQNDLDAYEAAERSCLVSEEEQSVFNRASNLIREAESLNSVVFFDASSNDPISVSSPTQTIDFARSITSPPPANDSKVSAVLGFSVSAKSSLMGHSPSAHYKKLSQSFMQKLCTLYPNGRVFNFNAHGSLSSASESEQEDWSSNNNTEEERQLRKIAPGVRSLAFFPLWNWAKSRWYSGAFAWSTDPMRVLDEPTDLTYLRAFSTNIMHEVSRLDVRRSEKSKDQFLSTISHEMRSPLHGILAGAEFLRDVPMDAFGENMLATIQTSGKTLLDTINHVLEYANISSSIMSSGGGLESKAMQFESDDIDLAQIIEEVVNSVCLGSLGKLDQEMQHNSSAFSNSAPATPETSRRPSLDMGPSMPYIIIRVDWTRPWSVKNVSSTAVRRIIMNLVRNSFKFTQSGYIIVSLKTANELSTGGDDTAASEGRKSNQIVLEVEDSGCGMSPEFLRHHIFTPFVKESALTPGIGLGLHLTRNMVNNFGGKLVFSSEVGVGTTARVTFPVSQLPETPTLKKISSTIEEVKGSNVAMLGFDKTETRGAQALKESLTAILGDALEMKITYLSSLSQSTGDIVIISDTTFEESVAQIASRDSDKPLVAPMIVLCQNFAYAHLGTRNYPHIQFVTPPFGPTSLARVFARCQTHQRSETPEPAFPWTPQEPLKRKITHRPSVQSFEDRENESNGVKRLKARSSPTESSPPNDQLSILTPTSTSTSTSAPAPKSTPTTVQPTSTDSPASTAVPLSSLRVIVVEDNEINLKLLVAFARKNKVPYEPAHNGKEALDKFRESLHGPPDQRFNTILTDVSMPVMDGLEFTRQVRKLERQFTIPSALVIALTGVSSELARRDATAAGVDVFLSKPAPFKQILRVLQTRAKTGPGDRHD